jgi:hypothetical protein
LLVSHKAGHFEIRAAFESPAAVFEMVHGTGQSSAIWCPTEKVGHHTAEVVGQPLGVRELDCGRDRLAGGRVADRSVSLI